MQCHHSISRVGLLIASILHFCAPSPIAPHDCLITRRPLRCRTPCSTAARRPNDSWMVGVEGEWPGVLAPRYKTKTLLKHTAAATSTAAALLHGVLGCLPLGRPFACLLPPHIFCSQSMPDFPQVRCQWVAAVVLGAVVVPLLASAVQFPRVVVVVGGAALSCLCCHTPPAGAGSSMIEVVSGLASLG